jgi:hypothetical protein
MQDIILLLIFYTLKRYFIKKGLPNWQPFFNKIIMLNTIYTSPCANIASATLIKPAILAPLI